MHNTRFMSRLFAATEEGDEELTGQVAKDIEDAKENGVVDTDEVRYEDEGNGCVSITDKGNGEVTLAEMGEDGIYDLCPASSAELEGYIHPGYDGVTPGVMNGGVEESVDAHMDGTSVIAPNQADGGLNFEAGHERLVEDLANEREFSVSTDNYVVQKIFSDQEFCERIFAEVIESEDTAKVGDLKVEKDPDDENAVIVTSESTGDQAKVVLDDDEMEVTELDTKELSYYDEDLEDLYRYYSECLDGECEDEECCDEEGNNFNDDDIDDSQQFDQLHVVGVDPENHVLVDAPEYDPESAQELAEDLTERGVANVQIFDDEDDARDYAMDLMANLGAESEDDIEEPEQAEFSDHTIYLTKFYSNHTEFMTKLYSDTSNGDLDTQKDVERAIEKGEEIETDDEIITPVDDETAIIEDKNNGEFTKAVLDDDTVDFDPISEDEAEDLKKDIVTEDDLEEAEKEYSEYEEDYYDYEPQVYSDEAGEKFFSEDEAMSDYMIRLFSDDVDGDENDIQDAIESGEQVETDDVVITPVDDETAVVEDKESGEFTKATTDGEKLDLSPISEDEAEDLMEDLGVEDEKEYSDYEDDRYYSNNEEEVYIESYPYRSELGYGYASTGDPIMDKFFAEVTQPGMMQNPQAQMQMAQQGGGMAPQQATQWAPGPNGGQIQVDAQGNPVEFDEQGNPIEYDENGNPMNAPVEQGPSLETIEDKAIAAVQSIQAAASEAEATIMNAKAAPVQQAEPDLQEAQFSYNDYDEDADERYFTDVDYEDVPENGSNVLVSWLNQSTQNFR